MRPTTAPQPKTHTVLLSEGLIDILVTVCWGAPLLGSQIHRLCAPHQNDRSIRKKLNKLEVMGLVTSWQTGGRLNGVPYSLGKIYVGTDAGYQLTISLSSEPLRNAPDVRHQIEHDLMVSEVLVRVAEKARDVMSSLFFAREQRIDPKRNRPRTDAILTLRYNYNSEEGRYHGLP